MIDLNSPINQALIKGRQCRIGGILLLFLKGRGLQQKGRGVKVEEVLELVERILRDKGPREMFLYAEEFLRSALSGLGKSGFNVLWLKVRQELIKKKLLKEDKQMLTLREELIMKGRVENQQQVIQNMLKERLGISVIAKVTGVSAREIKKLQNGNGRLKNGHFRNGRVKNGRTGNGQLKTSRSKNGSS